MIERAKEMDAVGHAQIGRLLAQCCFVRAGADQRQPCVGQLRQGLDHEGLTLARNQRADAGNQVPCYGNAQLIAQPLA